jgi:hypothetical protein
MPPYNPRPDIGDRLDGDPTFTMAELETIVEAAVLTERRATVADLSEWLEVGDLGCAAALAARIRRIERGEHRA